MAAHASPTRDSFGSHPISPASQQSSSGRPPSRKTSSGGNVHPNDITSTLAARAANNAAFNYNSPQVASSDRSAAAAAAAMPPSAPPRTSSSHQNGSSRRYTPDKLAESSRHGHADPGRQDHRHQDPNGHYDSPKSRRTPPSHIAYQQEPPRQTGSRDGRQQHETAMPIRTHQSETPRRTPDTQDGLSRIITNPEEASYRSTQSRDGGAAPAPSVPATGTPDDRRDRRRQEHPRTHKTSKFGDFILGNTIGEGEFGKVKLGWKQDSSVQVRRPSQQEPIAAVECPARQILTDI